MYASISTRLANTVWCCDAHLKGNTLAEYIGLNKDDISKPIYRIISFERLIELFKTKKMTFVKPKKWEKWDDPHENIIGKTIFNLGSILAESSLDPGITYNSHGNCWTTIASSDAIWRIYSKDNKSVRVESTPEVISCKISESLKKYPKSKLYIGKVIYYCENNIGEKVKEYGRIYRSGDICKAAAMALLYKRDSFKHEDEIRVVVIDQHDQSNNGILSISVDPDDMIKSVEIDSRASGEIVDVYECYLRNELNFKGTISRSKLYDVGRRWIYKEKPKN